MTAEKFVKSKFPTAGVLQNKGAWVVFRGDSDLWNGLAESPISASDAWSIAAANCGWAEGFTLVPPGIDMVNHPPHYQSEKGVECIDAIEAAMTVEEFRGYLRGNCLKYLWRAEKKGREEDLKKAAWYLNRLIETPKP